MLPTVEWQDDAVVMIDQRKRYILQVEVPIRGDTAPLTLPELPLFDPTKCVGCMECVAACPDTAILGKVLTGDLLDGQLATIASRTC